jgi:hypothetical protein
MTSTGAPTTLTGSWRDRVDAVEWDTVHGELDRYGCALTGPLLTADESAEIARLYPDVTRFRSTVDMRRHRFGEGEYRYTATGWCSPPATDPCGPPAAGPPHPSGMVFR